MARATLLSIVSGLLLSCSFPPAILEWLGWVAVAPLLFAARGRSVIEAMGSVSSRV